MQRRRDELDAASSDRAIERHRSAPTGDRTGGRGGWTDGAVGARQVVEQRVQLPAGLGPVRAAHPLVELVDVQPALLGGAAQRPDALLPFDV